MKVYMKYTKLLNNISNYRNYTLIRTLTGLQVWNEELTPDLKHKIERHWSSKLASPAFDEHDSSRDKYYVLSMFPYPSGHLHMGHVRVYTISDAIARFQRMNNRNVIHPIGWDAFGLPAENAALERNIAPHQWTQKNISHMKLQLQQLGCSFEWDREVSTCNPLYYRWTQELFLKLHNAGLVYQKQATVNWDPVDQTVLADEQVDENGRSWRSGAKVEQRLLKQWFIKTTRFAKSLLESLDDPALQDWRDIIKIQKHWIGECNGIACDFILVRNGVKDGFVTMWTPIPEYMEHAKFIAVSHSNILATAEGEILGEGTKKLHVKAENPACGEYLPIFATNEIEFGERDEYLGIPSVMEEASRFCDKYSIAYSPIKHLESKHVKERQQQICEKTGGYWTSSKLRDWLISRQRYWGTPIPIVHCKSCGAVPLPSAQLPVQLPKLASGVSRLAELSDWLNTICPKCNGPASRETDTMDTFVDSSWYYLRYLDPQNANEIFDVVKAKKIMPVDLYIGGKEHATLHLYYARFIGHFLHSQGMLPEPEPFKRLLVQGMVNGRSYRLKGTGQYVSPNQVTIIDAKKNKAVYTETQQPVVMAWEKMSKSKHNGVDPKDMFQEYGIDTTRLLILADVAPTSPRNWNSSTFPGVLNWQKRLWLTVQEFIVHRQNMPQMLSESEFKKQDAYMYDSRNFYVKGATFNYCCAQQLSVAISKMQGLTNSLRRMPADVFARSIQFERALACQLMVLAPMAPHFASELWSGFVSAPNRLSSTGEIQWDKPVLEQRWPEVDLDYKLDLVCEVNGTESSIVKIARQELEKLAAKQAIEIVLQQNEVQEAIGTRNVIKCSYKLYEAYKAIVNIVVSKQIAEKAVKN